MVHCVYTCNAIDSLVMYQFVKVHTLLVVNCWM